MFRSKPRNPLKGKRVDTFIKEEIEPQEILIDKLARKRRDELSMPEQKLKVLLPRKALLGIFFLFCFLFLVLIAKSFQLQIIEGENFYELAKKNYQKIYFIRPVRGVVYDSKGKQLVFNRPSFDLICLKATLPSDELEKEAVLSEVSGIINKDIEEIRERIEKASLEPILIDGNFDHETLILLETKIDELKGFTIEKNTTREYVDGSDFSHLLGFCGRINEMEKEVFSKYSMADYIGKSGVEKSYESILRGVPGEFKVERDVLSKEVLSEQVSSPEAGKSLVLWLDAGLQEKLKYELLQSLERIGAEKAAAVAIDPRTGGVLAMVSIPSFDNNLFSEQGSEEELAELLQDPLAPMFNRAMSGIGYPTGSTIKPLIAAAALQENIISPDENILCKGLISIENPYWPDIEPKEYTYRDWRVHGITNMYKAISESCNVYFYTIGGGYEDFRGLGPKRIKKYIELFGWGEKTRIDLPEEGKGIVPTINKDWRLGDTYHFSIGQGPFAITPLQVANAFSAIANKGILYEPRVVKKLIKGSPENPEMVEEIPSEVIREGFIDKENLEIIQKAMRQTVTSPSGSTHLFNDLPVSSAAKTGTAQTGKPGFNHAWVTVFAPYDDPQIVLTVMVESAPEDQTATLPVAKEVLMWYFSEQAK